MIRFGARGWELHRGPACAGCEPYPGLRNREWARLFLQQFIGDSLAMQAMRHLLWCEMPPWVMTKTSTLDATGQMADLLSQGIWHVHAPPAMKDETGGTAEGDTEEPDIAEIEQAPAAASSDPAPRPAPPPEEGSLPRNADEAAIAAAMKAASQLGIPFCEECARAALQRAQGAAVA